jgi:hypothetical protein
MGSSAVPRGLWSRRCRVGNCDHPGYRLSNWLGYQAVHGRRKSCFWWKNGSSALDDTIQSVLSDYPAPERRVTIPHLLNHTSGIPNFNTLPSFPERTDLTLSEVIELFKNLAPDFAPGDRYVYSNSGYVASRRCHRSVVRDGLTDIPAERFFRPLGMRPDAISLRRTDRRQASEEVTALAPKGFRTHHDVDDASTRGRRIRLNGGRSRGLGQRFGGGPSRLDTILCSDDRAHSAQRRLFERIRIRPPRLEIQGPELRSRTWAESMASLRS